MIYLLDSNVFIQAKRRYYGLDFCPAFWAWLIEQNNAGKVASIAAVREEIRVGKDELTKWANERDNKFFLEKDGKVISALGKVNNWVVHKSGYKVSAHKAFLGDPDKDVADGWLIAHAMVYDQIVVTEELPADEKQKVENRRKLKIPDVCKEFRVRYMNTFEMLRKEDALFVLGSKE